MGVTVSRVIAFFLSLCWEIFCGLPYTFITNEEGDVKFDLKGTESMIFFTYFPPKKRLPQFIPFY